MKISIIIPIYKVEAYLEQCVNSILNQTYRNIEIILVDDGSPDCCPAMCDALAEQDNRIKVIHKTNGGLSDARNAGLKIATGDYVTFVDSDDFWANDNCLELLVREAEKTPECDFIGYNCSYYYPSTEKALPWVEYNENITSTISSKDCISYLVASGTFPMSACMKLIKRESIQGKIDFIKGIYSEDIPWFITMLKKTSYCRFVNIYVYMYRKEVSESISSSFSEKKFTDLFNIVVDGVKDCKNDSKNETNSALLSFWAYELCILKGMLGYYQPDTRKEWSRKLSQYNWLFKYTLNPKVKKVSFIYRFFGNRITEYLLHKYLKTRLY